MCCFLSSPPEGFPSLSLPLAPTLLCPNLYVNKTWGAGGRVPWPLSPPCSLSKTQHTNHSPTDASIVPSFSLLQRSATQRRAHYAVPLSLHPGRVVGLYLGGNGVQCEWERGPAVLRRNHLLQPRNQQLRLLFQRRVPLKGFPSASSCQQAKPASPCHHVKPPSTCE